MRYIKSRGASFPSVIFPGSNAGATITELRTSKLTRPLWGGGLGKKVVGQITSTCDMQ